MGFGGAILATNRRTVDRQNRHNRDPELRERVSRSRRFVPAPLPVVWDGVPGWGVQNPLSAWAVEELLPAWGSMYDLIYPNHPPPEKDVTYKQSFTHSAKPSPGFTYNFDVSDQTDLTGTTSSSAIVVLDDDDVNSSTEESVEVTPTLVCARCLDPLSLTGSLDMHTEEAKKRRVWALRCGHMLDGKCIDVLMRPAFVVPNTMETADRSGVERGEGRIGESSHAAPVKATEKGKGVDRSHWQVQPDGELQRAAPSHPAGQIEGSSIRSSLRSSRLPAPSATASAPSALESSIGPIRSPVTRGHAAEPASPMKGRPKGKARARKAQVLVRHEYMCPVANCGRIHRSVLMAGEAEWKTDPKEGAVALFV